jgi:hypothetical protein
VATGIQVVSSTTGASSTILITDLTQGTVVIDVGGAKVGGSATGFANDTTTYGFAYEVDGVPGTANAVGSSMQDYTNLLSVINALITGDGATLALVDGNLVLTSDTVGAGSTIAITGPDGDEDLFASLTDFVAVGTAVDASGENALFGDLTSFNEISAAVDGENESETVYEADIEIDGEAPVTLQINGGDAQTFTELLAEILAQITPDAEIAIVGGNLRFTSATVGAGSAIAITDDTLFAALTGFVEVVAAVDGVGVDGNIFEADIAVNGGSAQTLEINVLNAATFGDLITEINRQVVGATVALVEGDLLFTSSTTGASSAIAITDDTLFSSLTGFSSVESATAGLAALNYIATIAVDGGAPQSVTITAATVTDFGSLVRVINAKIGGAIMVLENGNLKTRYRTPGTNSAIAIVDHMSTPLFSLLPGFVSIVTAVAGEDGSAGSEFRPEFDSVDAHEVEASGDVMVTVGGNLGSGVIDILQGPAAIGPFSPSGIPSFSGPGTHVIPLALGQFLKPVRKGGFGTMDATVYIEDLVAA